MLSKCMAILLVQGSKKGRRVWVYNVPVRRGDVCVVIAHPGQVGAGMKASGKGFCWREGESFYLK
jgi:hypothetical protein